MIRRAAVTLRRHRRRVATGVLVVLVLVATVGGLARVRIDTGIGSFLPAGDPALAALEEKAARFGGDPVVVLLQSPRPRGLLTGEQVLKLVGLEGELAGLRDVTEVYGPGTALNQIAGAAQDLLLRVGGARDAVRNAGEQHARNRGADGEEVAAAGRAATAELDRRYGALFVGALPAGLPTLRNPRFVESVLFDEGGAPRPQWKIVVPEPDTVAILVRPREGLDQAGAAALVAAVRATVDAAGLETARVTVTGVPAVTAALTERARQEAPLLGALGVAAVAGLFLAVPWTARRRSRLRPLAAALGGTAVTLAAFGWLGRPLSLGVVAFLPILLGIGSDFPLYLAQPTQRRRVLAAALAGAAGFASLALSPLPFVGELGLALAAGVLATVGVALLLRRWFDVAEPAAAPSPARPARAGRPARLAVGAVAVVVAALGWAALPQLSVEARPEQLARGLPALADAQHAERVLGSAGELSVVLRGGDVLTPEALAWARAAELALAGGYGDRLHPVTTFASLLQFLGPQPSAEQIRAAVELVPRYLTSAVVTPDHTAALLVYGVELTDLAQQRDLLAGIRAALPPPPPGLSVDVVGLPVAAVRGYEAVSSGRLATNLAGFAAAGLVLVVVLRQRADAGRAVLTVALATGWVLALTWLVAGALNPLTVVVGSLTTAVGCEFAVMLADAHRHGRAWLWRSVVLAAAAAAAGYLVLVASELAVLREFGLLLAAGVVLSCLAAVTVVRLLWPPAVEPMIVAEPTPARAAPAGAGTVSP